MATSANPLHGEDHHNRQNDTENNPTQRSKTIDPSDTTFRGELKQNKESIVPKNYRQVALNQPTMKAGQE